ncbi:type II toxin-antitoxin system YoeB family toxin [Actinoplanes auranticolor]|uniref:Endoribonuclease YoeB n=1 Tax=Actinoplanes auranticolor TaxID=47988 RepID=A0A919SP81_9ACTN|nr:type II toxin-antitoxin system YoeB family toxin [Actinoplanes auranticolor]GIM74313.1 hypothetical protein Aau02nite_60410 [Actinoplanes auranticolor]
MKLSWTDHAWDDYLYRQTQDRKTLKRSRRIDDEHRMVYAVETNEITIISCRYHYE